MEQKQCVFDWIKIIRIGKRLQQVFGKYESIF